MGAGPAAGARAALRRVPPSAVGRHAPAGDDRDRARRASPELLIADEATTALDVTTQAQIMELLRELQRAARHGAGHDQPRPRPGRELRRRGDRHVRRPRGRAAADARAVRATCGCRTRGRCWGRSRGSSARRTRRCRRCRAGRRTSPRSGRLPVRAALPRREPRTAARRAPPFDRAGAGAPLGLLASGCATRRRWHASEHEREGRCWRLGLVQEFTSRGARRRRRAASCTPCPDVSFEVRPRRDAGDRRRDRVGQVDAARARCCRRRRRRTDR